MRTKARKLTAILLTLVITIALFAGLQTAVLAANTDVNIAPLGGGDAIGTAIQTAVNSAATGDTVTVTGVDTVGVDGDMNLTIPEGKKVVWKATTFLHGSINLTGKGTFEVADGEIKSLNMNAATLRNMDDDYGVAIIVSGGTVIASGDYSCAIDAGDGSVTVSGGTVTAIDGEYDNIAIFCFHGSITITGGTVISSGDTAVHAAREGSSVTISGGTVKAAGGSEWGGVITVWDGTVLITGGTVTATGTNGYAIYVDGYGIAVYLQGTVTGAFKAGGETQWGIILEADSLIIPKARNATSEGLTLKACGTDADDAGFVWDTTGNKPVIQVTLEGNSEAERLILWGDYSGAAVAPGITGPTGMSLSTGYAATSTGAYTVTGTDPVTVTATGNDKITWNNATKKLDIAAGLAAGTYTVTLKAANGTAPDATFIFTLTVTSAVSEESKPETESNPLTGGNSNRALWLWIGGAAGMTLAGLTMVERRRKNPSKI